MSSSRSDDDFGSGWLPRRVSVAEPTVKIKSLGYIANTSDFKDFRSGDIVLWGPSPLPSPFNMGTMMAGLLKNRNFGEPTTTHVSIVIGEKRGDTVYTGRWEESNDATKVLKELTYTDLTDEEKAEPDGPFMAHFTEGGKQRKYFRHSLQRYAENNGIKGRSFQVARFREDNIAQLAIKHELVRDAADRNKWDDEMKHWSVKRAIESLIKPGDRSGGLSTEEKFNAETAFICSGFVATILPYAAQRVLDAATAAVTQARNATPVDPVAIQAAEEKRVSIEAELAVRSFDTKLDIACFPATLEHVLYTFPHVDFLVHSGTRRPGEPGINPYEDLLELARNNILHYLANKMAAAPDSAVSDKYERLTNALDLLEAQIKNTKLKIPRQTNTNNEEKVIKPIVELNEVEKALILFSRIKDILLINTGKILGTETATSYVRFLNAARERRIFLRDLDGIKEKDNILKKIPTVIQPTYTVNNKFYKFLQESITDQILRIKRDAEKNKDPKKAAKFEKLRKAYNEITAYLESGRIDLNSEKGNKLAAEILYTHLAGLLQESTGKTYLLPTSSWVNVKNKANEVGLQINPAEYKNHKAAIDEFIIQRELEEKSRANQSERKEEKTSTGTELLQPVDGARVSQLPTETFRFNSPAATSTASDPLPPPPGDVIPTNAGAGKTLFSRDTKKKLGPNLPNEPANPHHRKNSKT